MLYRNAKKGGIRPRIKESTKGVLRSVGYLEVNSANRRDNDEWYVVSCRKDRGIVRAYLEKSQRYEQQPQEEHPPYSQCLRFELFGLHPQLFPLNSKGEYG